MAMIYDNACDECGQDRDSERRVRALREIYNHMIDTMVDAVLRADRAEHTLASYNAERQREQQAVAATHQQIMVEIERLRDGVTSAQHTITSQASLIASLRETLDAQNAVIKQHNLKG